MDLYYGDESHLCEEAYVPYGWKFSKADVYILFQCGKRLNCFAMIDRRCRTHWFTTENSIDANSIISYLDDFSLTIERKTVIVLDNAPIHGARKLLELRPLWEKRGLHIFFLPPYSPHLNIAEILWPLLKGKWLQPRDYLTPDTLFYAANRALATMGDGLMINFRNHAA
ncbi:MAG: transposase [Bacteroides sp.]|nr:transposase [Bacteroides sp.]